MPTNLPIHQTTNSGSNPVGSHQVCQPASDSTVRGHSTVRGMEVEVIDLVTVGADNLTTRFCSNRGQLQDSPAEAAPSATYGEAKARSAQG
jgi:hypothetical protein